MIICSEKETQENYTDGIKDDATAAMNADKCLGLALSINANTTLLLVTTMAANTIVFLWLTVLTSESYSPNTERHTL